MKRFNLLILILALMLAFTVPAFAQGDCGDLSAEDCDILYGSSDAMMDVVSGSQYIGVEVQAMNVPQTPITDSSFAWTLDTTYSYTDDAVSAAMAMQEMSAEEMAALYADPAALTDMVVTVLSGMSASIDMTTDFSDELVGLIAANGGGQFPSSVVLSVVMDGGIAYLDLGTLEPLLGDAGMGGMTGWIGIDVIPWVEASLMQSSADPNTALAASVSTQAGAGPLYTQIAGVDMGMVTPFLNIARGEDTEVDGEAAASFVTTIDWQAFVDSPYFDQLIGLALSQSGAMPSDAEMEQTITLAKMFGPALLEGIVVELVENVGVDSGYLLSSDFTFDWNLSDLAALSA
ncbi:MAG: hypothetical protein KDD84_23045, partial [Caldilineaceae bacterium]|nr:hypothetical protein [Caldilineaceae bacterium]